MVLWDDRFTIDTINETILQYYDGSYPLAQLLYAGDDVSGEEWDSRNWNTQKNIRYELLRIAIEVIKKL